MAASPLNSWGPKRGRKCHATPAFLGVPNAKHGEQNEKWSATKGNKIRKGCLRAAVSGVQKRAEMLCHPWSTTKETKSEMAALALPSREPKRGRKCYITPAFSRVPNAKRGEQNEKWLPHPYILGGLDKIRRAPEEGTRSKVATSPRRSWGSP